MFASKTGSVILSARGVSNGLYVVVAIEDERAFAALLMNKMLAGRRCNQNQQASFRCAESAG
jgi:hypothetical protein